MSHACALTLQRCAERRERDTDVFHQWGSLRGRCRYIVDALMEATIDAP